VLSGGGLDLGATGVAADPGSRSRAEKRRDAAYIEVFLYLQLLDFMTTLIGMKLGLGEASPFIRSLMHLGPSAGLAASKLVAFALCGLCVWLNKRHVVRWINYWYAALVFWNMSLIASVLKAG
jgi:hypothetical protein